MYFMLDHILEITITLVSISFIIKIFFTINIQNNKLNNYNIENLTINNITTSKNSNSYNDELVIGAIFIMSFFIAEYKHQVYIISLLILLFFFFANIIFIGKKKLSIGNDIYNLVNIILSTIFLTAYYNSDYQLHLMGFSGLIARLTKFILNFLAFILILLSSLRLYKELHTKSSISNTTKIFIFVLPLCSYLIFSGIFFHLIEKFAF